MRRPLHLPLLWASAITLAFSNILPTNFPSPEFSAGWQTDSVAEARSSGGRSRGGSFRSRPSRQSAPSNPSRSTERSQPRYNDGGYRPYVAPVPYYGGGSRTYGSSSGLGLFGLLILLGVGGLLVYLVFAYLMKKGGTAGGAQELDNDIVTVTKLQIALLAEARSVQVQLSDISQDADTETSEGLTQLLQESALALLRAPEYWTHVLASSQTVKSREEAEAAFERLSVAERSKFTAETLTNVAGRSRQQQVALPNPEEDPAAYIVVTFLVGTADDKPLFTEVRTSEALQAALEKLAGVPTDYLLVFELLWSPQMETDSLTYDELLTEYSDMAQI